MTELSDVKPVKLPHRSRHDAPRSHTLQEKNKCDDVPNFETSPNVAQTVRSCAKKLVPSDEIFEQAKRGMVDLNVFFLKSARTRNNREICVKRR